MKKIIIFIIIIFIIAFIGFFIFKNKKNPYELILYGNIEIRTVDLGFQVSGQIKKMLKEEGDKVKAGELIAELDNRDYKSNFEKAKANSFKNLALKNDANSNFNKKAPLLEDNTISKMEYDNLFNTKEKAEAEYKSSLAEVKYAKNQFDYTKLYAPEEGIVMVRVEEVGTTVNKGQIVYTLAKNKPIWVRAYIEERDLGNIKYGMKVKVLTDTINPITHKNKAYIGYIGYISPVSEFTPKTVQTTDLRPDLVYRIRVYIYDTDEYLRQGMPTTIKIDLRQDKNEHGRNKKSN